MYALKVCFKFCESTDNDLPRNLDALCRPYLKPSSSSEFPFNANSKIIKPGGNDRVITIQSLFGWDAIFALSFFRADVNPMLRSFWFPQIVVNLFQESSYLGGLSAAIVVHRSSTNNNRKGLILEVNTLRIIHFRQ
jgi:hypothetical protein